MTPIREYKIGDIIEGEWYISQFSVHRTRRIPVRVRGKLEIISYCDARVIEVLDVQGDDRLGIDIEPIKAEYEGRIMTHSEMDTNPWRGAHE